MVGYSILLNKLLAFSGFIIQRVYISRDSAIEFALKVTLIEMYTGISTDKTLSAGANVHQPRWRGQFGLPDQSAEYARCCFQVRSMGAGQIMPPSVLRDDGGCAPNFLLRTEQT
jgi:hypothetical protein